ncbi:LOW QUALITY PROTEIN: uncharacterized protein LOC133344041 [Lethenteron reissneri]|uniref:LOW QUALITY PROTEIN: uncharacterized protein LOC133344041 n=1 Tax=Lethenteron reissneri TaxID=7753 RepID=UPI002AB73584|nr:LOW QUALITY PROTEIN: uncharacterized protein LOC133344041 [Lethenteron reissneri]
MQSEQMNGTPSSEQSRALTHPPDGTLAHYLGVRHAGASALAEPITAKRVYFYKSGDPQFGGLKVAINNRTFKTFDALLDNLSRRMPLPFGVRTVSTPRGLHAVRDLEQLEDGKAYVCSDRRRAKPLDLEQASRRPQPWRSSRRPLTSSSSRRQALRLLRRQEMGGGAEEPRLARATPRRLTLVRNGDATGPRYALLLSRRSASSGLAGLLADASQIMGFSVARLYTTDGRKVESLQALLHVPSTLVAAGREPFQPLLYDAMRLPLLQNPRGAARAEGKTKGRFKVWVSTGELAAAGTDARVSVTLYGERGHAGPILLGAGSGGTGGTFSKGSEDEFTVSAGNVGELYKIRVSHDNSGESPGWLCQAVRLLDLHTKEEFEMRVNRWLSRDEDDGEICREVAVPRRTGPVLPAVRYEVRITTGELWNAGTEGRVHVAVHGERGDTGPRLLQRSRHPTSFQRGQTDVFRLEAVHLGRLQRVLVSHDSEEPGKGWYLEKVVIQDPLADMESVFLCHRWLDTGEDDGKTSRDLNIVDRTLSAAQQEQELLEKELWAAEGWKFQRGSVLQLRNKLTGRLLRIKPDASVDALGEKGDKYSYFEVARRRGNVRAFNSLALPAYYLAVEQNHVVGMSENGPACDFSVCVQRDRSVQLASVRLPGHAVLFTPHGRPGDTKAAAQGPACLFYVHVKGVFRDGAVLLLNSSTTQALSVSADGRCSGAGRRLEASHLRVHVVAPRTCMFESVAFPRRFLRVKDGHCDGLGIGDKHCHFIVHKQRDWSSVGLESARHKGIFVGLQADGQARPLVNAGEANTTFYPQVISFGREKASRHLDLSMEETPRLSSALSPVPLDTPKGWEWRVLVTTGSEGTGARVQLWVYGERGSAGPIFLGKGEHDGIFSAKQEDEFQITLPDLGKIYKIRVAHDGSSENPDWKLQQVVLRGLRGGDTLRFPANRWLSRRHGDGQTVRELPAVRDATGKPLHPVLRYRVSVSTGDEPGAETQAPLFLCLHGERGDSGERELLTSDHAVPFRRGQTDVFELEAVSLGELRRVSLRCDARAAHDRWFCHAVSVRESPHSDLEYGFPCNGWIPEEFSVEDAQREKMLLLEEIRKVTPLEARSEVNESEWKILVVTGDGPDSGTEATVSLVVYGEHGASRTLLLGSGESHLFKPRSVDSFRISLPELGELYKLRVGHSGVGEASAWFLERVRLKPAGGRPLELPVTRWLADDRDDGDTWREVPVPRPGKRLLPVVVYQLSVLTGGRAGADTDARVHASLWGERGDSGARLLHRSLNNPIPFQEGQMDVFRLEAVSLGELRKVVIGHDGTSPGQGWFLDRVVVKVTGSELDREYVFPCERWLDQGRDDGKVERELEAQAPILIGKTPKKDTRYRVTVITASDSLPPLGASASLVAYGAQGRSDEMTLPSVRPGHMGFLPGSSDTFLVDPGDVGELYKVRLSVEDPSEWQGWHLDALRLEEVATGHVLAPADARGWLSRTRGKRGTTREFAVAPEGRPLLPVHHYVVSVHVGERWGAETFAGVYMTLYGEAGDTGCRKLLRSLQPGLKFQRGRTDSFLVEAVSLGQVRKVVIGHDGEGYGSGLFVKMVTVRESNSAARESLFPCWAWLDDHMGERRTVRKLHLLGERAVAETPNHLTESRQAERKEEEEEKDDLSSTSQWKITVLGAPRSDGEEQEEEEEGKARAPPHLRLALYGTRGSAVLHTHVLSSCHELTWDVPRVGELLKLRASVDPEDDVTSVPQEGGGGGGAGGGSGGGWGAPLPAWLLRSVRFTPPAGGPPETSFLVEAWLGGGPGGRYDAEVPALRPGVDPLPALLYVVEVHTGEARGGGADGRVCVHLHGERGDSGRRWLDGRPRAFRRGQVDVFKVEAVHLGELRLVTVGYSGHREGGWLLERVVVTEGEAAMHRCVFSHGGWIMAAPGGGHGPVEVSLSLTEKLKVLPPDRARGAAAPSRGLWDAWVMSAEAEGPGIWPPAVHAVAYGTLGKSPPLPIGNVNDRPFLLHIGDVGDLRKLSFVCTEGLHGKGILLSKVRLKDRDTREELGFEAADVWLFGKDGTEPVTELAVIRPDCQPLLDVEYEVRVRTGDVPAAGTHAPVHLTLVGEFGDTGPRPLRRGDHRDAFLRGQTSMFAVRAVDLGPLTSVRVGVRAAGLGSGWFLDTVAVRCSPGSPGSRGAASYAELLFPCRQWLDDGVGDRSTERTLRLLGETRDGLGETPASHGGSWTLRLHTGDFPDAGTELGVSVTVCCRAGAALPIGVPRGALRARGRHYEASLVLPEELGPVVKVRIEMEEGEARDSWYCRKVTLRRRRQERNGRGGSGEEDGKKILKFPFVRWFSPDNGGQVSELPLLSSGSPESPIPVVLEYVVSVRTGSSESSATTARVWLTVTGERGDTGRRALARRRGERSFAKGRVTSWSLEAVELGPLREVLVEKGPGSDWHVEAVSVREGPFAPFEAVFQAHRWLRDGAAGSTASVRVPLTEVRPSAVTVAPLPSDAPAPKSDGRWRVELTLGNEDDDDGDGGGSARGSPGRREQQQTLLLPPGLCLVVYGSEGKTSPLPLVGPRHGTGDGGASSTIAFEVSFPVSVGVPYKVRLGARDGSAPWEHGPGGGNERAGTTADTTAAPHLRRFRMTDVRTRATFTHAPGEALPPPSGGDVWMEIPAEWPQRPAPTVLRYQVLVFGEDFIAAQPAPRVTLMVVGTHGDSGERWLGEATRGDQHGVHDQPVMVFEVKAVDLGELRRAILSASCENDYNIQVDKIVVKNADSTDNTYEFELEGSLNVLGRKPAISKEMRLIRATRSPSIGPDQAALANGDFMEEFAQDAPANEIAGDHHPEASASDGAWVEPEQDPLADETMAAGLPEEDEAFDEDKSDISSGDELLGPASVEPEE